MCTIVCSTLQLLCLLWGTERCCDLFTNRLHATSKLLALLLFCSCFSCSLHCCGSTKWDPLHVVLPCPRSSTLQILWGINLFTLRQIVLLFTTFLLPVPNSSTFRSRDIREVILQGGGEGGGGIPQLGRGDYNQWIALYLHTLQACKAGSAWPH